MRGHRIRCTIYDNIVRTKGESREVAGISSFLYARHRKFDLVTRLGAMTATELTHSLHYVEFRRQVYLAVVHAQVQDDRR